MLPRSQDECAHHWSAVCNLLEDEPTTPETDALNLEARRSRVGERVRAVRAQRHERAGRAARLSEDARMHVLVGGGRVRALYRCGDGDAAMAIAAPLLEIAESYGSPHLRAAARSALGLAHLPLGNRAEAARILEEELTIIEEFDAFREFEAQDRACLAEALLGCGELERALESAERALDVATAQGREARTYEIDARLALVRVRVHTDRAYRPQADLDLIARLIESTGALSLQRRLDELRVTTVGSSPPSQSAATPVGAASPERAAPRGRVELRTRRIKLGSILHRPERLTNPVCRLTGIPQVSFEV